MKGHLFLLLTDEKNILLVRRALETLNTGDLSGVSEFISPHYFNHESKMDPTRSKMRGPEEFMDTVKNIRKAVTDLHYEEEETLASNNKVISIVKVTGKHTGSFFDFIPPTGNEICYKAVHVHTIGGDGKIVEHRAVRDDLALMYQMGVVMASSPQYGDFLNAWKGTK